MTDFHMPDSWFDPPDEPDPCESCNGEGCINCDGDIAADWAADVQMQAMKEGER